MQTNNGADTPATVGVVDNDSLTLGALRAVLTRMDGIDVAWTASDGSHAIDLCRDPHTRPNVLLADMSMEPLPGAEVCRRIRTAGIPVGVVCITSFTLQTYAAQAARAGAQAIVSKTDLQGIRNSIRQAAQGKASPSPVPGVMFRDVEEAVTTMEFAFATAGLPGNDSDMAAPATPAASVSPSSSTSGLPSARELQIIRMLADGMETDEISQALCLSRYTITTYLRRACGKLGARNRTNLIAICERRGLL